MNGIFFVSTESWKFLNMNESIVLKMSEMINMGCPLMSIVEKKARIYSPKDGNLEYSDDVNEIKEKFKIMRKEYEESVSKNKRAVDGSNGETFAVLYIDGEIVDVIV
jgi:hypothetical protein